MVEYSDSVEEVAAATTDHDYVHDPSPRSVSNAMHVIDLSDADDIKAVGDDKKDFELFGLTSDSSLLDRIRTLSSQSAPVIISFFLNLGGTFITLLFAARFTPNYEYNGDSSVLIAGVNLANLYANVSCLSILIGMSSAVETLGSQHNGAGNYREVGIVFQRSCCVLMTLAVPVLCSWFFAYDLFTSFGVEHDVSTVIAGYLEIRALSVPLDVINFSYEKYLMSIGVMQPSMWANITFNVALVVFNSIFIIGLKCRFRFLAVSWVLSAGCLFVVQIGMSMKYEEVHRTLQPWFVNWDCFRKWGEFFTLGLPGTIMLCSEWWAFEALTLMAARLGTAEVAAQATIMQISSMSFMIPMGLGVATGSLVGNFVGAKQRSLAISFSHLALAYIALLEIIMGIAIITGGKYFVHMFTSDEGVRHVAESAIPFLSIFTMIDGLQGVGAGVLRGAGKQYVGAVANIIAFYGFGLPMSAVLCFRLGYGVDGLIMGIAFATSFQVTVIFILIFGFESYLFGNAAVTIDADMDSSNLHEPTERGKGKRVSMFPSVSATGEIEFQQLRTEEDSFDEGGTTQKFTVIDSEDMNDLEEGDS